ncbi:MAG: hypothetical protein IJI38_00180, partial [Clostridia bacterium]|nr:hypothetical protein [Clostridia bacterium]
MGFVLCPRCELNYMSDKDTYCSICMQEVRGIAPREEVELCSICNENPVLPGKDVCAECLREMENREKDEPTDEDAVDNGDDMDEMLPMDDADDQSFGDMENALS